MGCAYTGTDLSCYLLWLSILQVPAGILADKYPQSCIWLIGVGYLLSAIFTLFVPLAAYAGGAPLIITLRILSGLSEVGGSSTFFL